MSNTHPDYGATPEQEQTSRTLTNQDGRRWISDFNTRTSVPRLQEDENFLVQPFDRKSNRRLAFLFHVVFLCCARNAELTRETWLKLLDGDTEVHNLWLWVDGDGTEILKCLQLRWANTMFLNHKPTSADYQSAVSALSCRLQRTEGNHHHGYRRREEDERRRRVQEATPYIRFCIVVWLVIISNAMKDADASRGLNTRETWDLKGLIADWHSCITNILTRSNDISHPLGCFQTFDRNMTAAGHTCHASRDISTSVLTDWLNMRSVLAPEQYQDAVHLSLSKTSQCKACCEQ